MPNFRAAIVYSNFWVAMACTSLYLLHTAHSFHPQWYPVFLLSATAGAYNYMRLAQHKRNAKGAIVGYKKWVGKHLSWVAFLTSFFLAIAGYFLLKIWNASFMLWLFAPALLSLLYPVSLRKHLPLRQLPGIKLLLISFVWAYMVVFLPAVYFEDVTYITFFNFIWTLFLVAALTIPFDVRDMQLDNPEMRTLPMMLGRKKALQIAQFLLGINQLLSVLGIMFFGWSLHKSVALILVLELACLLLKKLPKEGDEFYTSFWIEGIPIFGFILCWLFSYLISFL